VRGVSVHEGRPMEGKDRARSWVGRALIDPDGATIGRIQKVFLDHQTGEATWAAVQSPDRPGEAAIVPLRDVVEETDALRVPVARARALAAPGIDVSEGRISADQGQILIGYYTVTSEAPVGSPGAGRDPVGLGGTEDLPSVVRSEEELTVEKRIVAHERVRLVKRVVTETVTRAVEVRREELHIERLSPEADPSQPRGASAEQDPGSVNAASGENDAAGRLANLTDRLPRAVGVRLASLRRAGEGARERLGGPRAAFSDDVIDIVLMQEEVIVSKRVVPRERIRLRRETVTDHRQITDALRRERVELNRLPDPPR
jgi:stress response protein YsnF/sporulation protein YlmC with PRC-barrel domain